MRTTRVLAAALCAAALIGCDGGDKPKQESIEVKPQAELEQAKALLENYAKGQALGSEVSDFPRLVSGVRATDPARADVLEKGFADLQKPKANLAAKAKQMLAALRPKQTE